MSTAGRVLTGVLALCLLLYPVLVYTGLNYAGPRLIAGVLLVAVVVRLLLMRFAGTRAANLPINGYWLLVAALVVTSITLATGSAIGLKFYPVLVSGVLLAIFGLSLWNPPPLIERIARLQQPDLPPQAIAYTRRVTQIWCGFFLLNGLIALTTVFASKQVWALYNGFIAYVAMGLLMLGEYLVRRRVKAGHAASAGNEDIVND